MQLFGFRKLSGDRRFTTALFLIGRKNAKSTICAAILLYVLCCEREHGPQVYSAATTGNQARIVWRIAKLMVERLPDLRHAFDVEAFANSIVRYANGGSMRPINAKASSQDGLNPSALCLDELHAHRTHDLKNVLTSAAGARSNPLFVFATTEGYELPGPWAEERGFACNVLEEVITADHYLALMFAVDDDDEDFDAGAWIKANPLLVVSATLGDAIAKDAMEAKQKPGSLAEFRIKRLNRRATSARGCIDLRKLRRCAARFDLDQLVGAPCWAAYDGASTGDMAAWRLLWWFDDKWWTWGRYWVPRDAVSQRTERGSVNYQGWVDAGLVTASDGNVNDFARIERDILSDFKRFGPQQVAYDPYNATQLAVALQGEGMPMLQFIQGPRSYHPAWQSFETAYTSERLRYGADDQVLFWNFANLVDRRDVNMNFAPDRRRAADKIDGACALIMCFGLAQAHDAPTAIDSDYAAHA